MVRLENLHDQADDAARREELAALLAFRAGELAEEIFVDPAEGVVFESLGNLRDFLEQLLKQCAVENLIRARQHAGELRVVLLDIRHRLVDCLADVLAFRQVQQMVVARIGSEIDHSLGMVGTRIVDARRPASRRAWWIFQLQHDAWQTALRRIEGRSDREPASNTAPRSVRNWRAADPPLPTVAFRAFDSQCLFQKVQSIAL